MKLANKHKIEAKCFHGVQYKEECKIIYKETHEIPILCENKVRVIFAPSFKCTKHSQECRLYWWKTPQEKIILGPGDFIINLVRWWIGCPFLDDKKTHPGHERQYYNKRYAMSDGLVESLIYELVRNYGTCAKWCRARIHEYCKHLKQLLLRQDNDFSKKKLYNQLDITKMMEEIANYFDEKTIKGIVNEIAIGYFKECNEIFEKELFSHHWVGEYHVDASHQTQDNIIAKETGEKAISRISYSIKATESRVTCFMSFMLGHTILLENGNEYHKIIFGYQVPNCIAKNMKYIQYQPQHFYNHCQNDRATHNNVQNVRNITVEGIKKQLSILDPKRFNEQDVTYTNPYGVIFDFRRYAFILSQEIQHISHRLGNLGAFKWHHTDCGYFKKDMNIIIKNMRLQYDPVETPTILYTNLFDGPEIKGPYYTPYELIKKCNLLKDSRHDYSISRALRALWMRRGTKQSKHKAELDKYWKKKHLNLTLPANQQQQSIIITKDEIRKEFTFIIKHCAPHQIPAFFSVK